VRRIFAVFDRQRAGAKWAYAPARSGPRNAVLSDRQVDSTTNAAMNHRTPNCSGRRPGFIAALLVTLAMASSLVAREHRVASAADIMRVSAQAKPGDVIVMRNGAWSNQVITFSARGTAKQPVTLRAATPGKVVLTGKSWLTVEGEHLVVSGLLFQNSQATNDGIRLAGRHSRVTECAVVGGDNKFFVRLFGISNRLDHCYLAGKTNDSPTLQVEVEGRPNHHRIDHNHFGHRPPLGHNGGETIRVGYSHQSMTNSGTLVEHNLFERCDGELEIISNKSCENTYRANTFWECAGMFTLRHGNRCVVGGNFFIGHHKHGSGGIRVIGEDHVVINNYIEGVENGGFWITSGISNSELKGYFQSRNCVIAFNTFVDSRGPAIELDAGFGTSGRTLRPENITIANNIFMLSEGMLLKGREGGSGYRWLGNIAWPAAAEHPGIRFVDPKLERVRDGFWRPKKDSPATDAAEGNLPFVRTDIDGQSRTGRLDVGCDEGTRGAVMNRPLTASDVGPAWMSVNARAK
jgi:poly(beta-D-mannuronate) lyase